MTEKHNPDLKQFLVRLGITVVAAILVMYLAKVWFVDPFYQVYKWSHFRGRVLLPRTQGQTSRQVNTSPITKTAGRIRPTKEITGPQDLGVLAHEAGLTLEEFAALGQEITGKGMNEPLTPQEIDAIAGALEEIKRGERPKPTISTSRQPAGIKVISWQDAAKHYGEYVTVEGTIVTTHNSGKACFLNFHPNYKRYLTVVIFASAFPRFPAKPENYYHGKKVRVSGYIKEYKGKPEIILNDPSQIEILK